MEYHTKFWSDRITLYLVDLNELFNYFESPRSTQLRSVPVQIQIGIVNTNIRNPKDIWLCIIVRMNIRITLFTLFLVSFTGSTSSSSSRIIVGNLRTESKGACSRKLFESNIVYENWSLRTEWRQQIWDFGSVKVRSGEVGVVTWGWRISKRQM